MSEVVRTFLVTASAFRSEILNAFARVRKPVRRIDVIMTDDYKRRTRSWQIDDLPYDNALHEVSDFVGEAIGNGMRECMLCLTSDD